MTGIPFNRPGSGDLLMSGCDECNKTVPLNQRRKAVVKLGKLRGLRGFVCTDCLAKRKPGVPA